MGTRAANFRSICALLVVIPARLVCLAREESLNPGPFARQPRARVTQTEASMINMNSK